MLNANPTNYGEFFPLMSPLRGSGSPIVQNIAGRSSGISGNVTFEQNLAGSVGPDPFYIPFVSDVAKTVQDARPGLDATVAVDEGVSFLETQAGQLLKRFYWGFFAYSLIILGIIFLLWGPGKRAIKTAVDVAV